MTKTVRLLGRRRIAGPEGDEGKKYSRLKARALYGQDTRGLQPLMRVDERSVGSHLKGRRY